MKSRVHPKYKTQYRVGNWAEYDRALVRRGDVTLWLTPDAIATWAAAGVGSEVFTIENESKSGETTKTYVIARHFLEMAAAQNWPLDGTPVPTENLVPPLCTLGIIEDLASAC